MAQLIAYRILVSVISTYQYEANICHLEILRHILLKVSLEDPMFFLKHLKSPPKYAHLSIWKREVQFETDNRELIIEHN